MLRKTWWRAGLLGLSIALLTNVTSCADQRATEYLGSALDDATADSAARLRITLWVRSDSILGGYLNVGAPLPWSGHVDAWREDGTLVLLAVTSQGDTTYWTSRSTDDSIGGRFRVAGGERRGVRGTWRATRVRGPAAGAAALVATNRAVVLEVTTTVLAFVGLIALAIVWIRRSPLVPLAGPSAFNPMIGAPIGLSGWLAFFLVAQGAVVIAKLVRLGASVEPFRNGLVDLGRAIDGYAALLTMEMLLHWGQILLPTIGVVLALRRSRFTRRYWLAYLASVGAILTTDIVGLEMIRPRFAEIFGSAWSPATAQPSLNANYSSIVSVTLWSAYWTRSERVRLTFATPSPDVTPASPSGPTTEETVTA